MGRLGDQAKWVPDRNLILTSVVCCDPKVSLYCVGPSLLLQKLTQFTSQEKRAGALHALV